MVKHRKGLKEVCFPFTARKEVEADIAAIVDWLLEHPTYTINSVFNSFIPHIAYVLQNFCQLRDGIIYVTSDFGDVPLLARYQKFKWILPDANGQFTKKQTSSRARGGRRDWTA